LLLGAIGLETSPGLAQAGTNGKVMKQIGRFCFLLRGSEQKCNILPKIMKNKQLK